MKAFIFTITFTAVLSLCNSRLVCQEAATVYRPATTTVAVLPSPNMSADKWTELKAKESAEARKTTEAEFVARGFKITPDDQVDNAMKTLNIDTTQEDQWTKANLYKLGKQVGANLVAFIVVKQTRQKVAGSFLLRQQQGEAEVETWLVDADHEQPILNDVPARGAATRAFSNASARRLAAVRAAVTSAIGRVLKPYPTIATNSTK